MGMKCKISWMLSMMMVLSMLSLCPVKAEESASAGLDANSPTEAEITKYLNDHDIDSSKEDTYQTNITERGQKSQYDVADAGKLSQETQQKALDYFNAMRYIAGLDPVTTNDSDHEIAQCSAYVNYLRGEMSHTIGDSESIVSQLSTDLLKKARTGSRHGNLDELLATYETEYMKLVDSVYDWFDDSDGFNISNVGHRRWCLDPYLSEVGFGRAAGKAPEGAGYDNEMDSTMYYQTQKTSASQSSIAWPAQNMPVGYFYSGEAWSYLSTNALSDDGVTVDLALKESKMQTPGKTWHMTKGSSSDGDVYTSYYIDAGYILGHTDAVVFVPNGIQVRAGDVYNVKISGIGKDVNYNVSFFDPHPVTDVILDDKLLDGSDKWIIADDEQKYDLTDYLYLKPHQAQERHMMYESSNPSVVTVNQGTVTTHQAGEATITVKNISGASLSIPVKVCPHIVKVPEGKKLTYNATKQTGITLSDGMMYDSRSWGTNVKYEAMSAGDYSYRVKLKDGFTWEDGTTDHKEIEWSIAPTDNTVESFDVQNVVYPNKPQVNAKLKYYDDDKVIEYKRYGESDYHYSTEMPTGVGSYMVRLSESGSRSVNEVSVTKNFTIFYKTIPVPEFKTSFTYDGKPHNVCEATDDYDVSEPQSEPGTYQAIVTLKDKNYCWSDHTITAQRVTFTISKPQSEDDHETNNTNTDSDNTSETPKTDDAKNHQNDNTTNSGQTSDTPKSDNKKDQQSETTTNGDQTSETPKSDDTKDHQSETTTNGDQTSDAPKTDDTKNHQSETTTNSGQTSDTPKSDDTKDHQSETTTNSGQTSDTSKTDDTKDHQSDINATNNSKTTETSKTDDTKNHPSTNTISSVNKLESAKAADPKASEESNVHASSVKDDDQKKEIHQTDVPTAIADDQKGTDLPVTQSTSKPLSKTKGKTVNTNGLSAIKKEVTSSQKADLTHATYRGLMARQGKTTRQSSQLKWKKIKGAKQYLIFGSKVHKKYQYLGMTKKASYTVKGLKKGTYYKYTVIAVNAKNKKLAISKAVYVVTNKKIAKIQTNKTLKVKKGKSVKVKASLKGNVKIYRKMKLESSNSKIAKVKGMKVKGLKKGKCAVYAYAQNGTCVKIKVTVK